MEAKCSDSCPGSFTPRERASFTDWIGGWVGPRTSLDDVERRKILILSGPELRPFGRPTRSQSLYRQHYPSPYKMGYKYVCNFQTHYYCFMRFTVKKRRLLKCFLLVRHSKNKSTKPQETYKRSKPIRTATLTRRRLLWFGGVLDVNWGFCVVNYTVVHWRLTL
jgi:hypothetical protein